MRQLHKAVLSPTAQAPSVPNIWPALAARGISFRVGEVSMIAGRPSTGKSMVALNLAYRAKVPTLYVSADSHMATQSIRLMSIITGKDQKEMEELLTTDRKRASDLLRSEPHLRWDWTSNPRAELIEELVEAHAEMFSNGPTMLIVDNLTDVMRDPGDEWGKQFLLDMKFLARKWELAAVILHHMSLSRPHQPGTVPPLEAIQGKTAETPALVLSVTTQDGWLGIGAVKNRYGLMDSHGQTFDWFAYEPARAWIGESERAGGP